MLARFHGLGVLKAHGRQCTDSTRVLATVRTMDLLESVGETLRAALNALAVAAPDWLTPRGRTARAARLRSGVCRRARLRKALARVVGTDGHRLLAAACGPFAPPWLRDLPAVQVLHWA